MQLSVVAVAALAVFAVAAVMLLAGGAPAQATATMIAPGGEDNSMPQQQGPRHAAPEACPAEGQAARVVDSGHYALFDVYWNPEEGELTNNPCPPSVEHVPGSRGSARDDRSPSSINILAEPPTIIHIPISAKVDLADPDTPYTETNFQDLWDADNLENRDTNGDGIVWALPACPPDGDPSEVGLCISFSAALLEPTDWDGNIEYLLGHVHQIDIDKQDPRYTLVYDVPAGGATGELTPLWDSSDARSFVTEVEPGGYDRPTWFFTSRGTYEFQVLVRGNPDRDKGDPVSKDESVTSDVREYIIHVGAESDLGVTTSVEPALATGDATLDPGDNVTIEITASNAGPDTAPSTRVDVALPEGLTYSSHSAATGTEYNPTTGVWNIGELAVTNDENSPALTITATVDGETHGKTLTAEATISATEPVEITEIENGVSTVKTYHVPVLDQTPGNNMDTGTATVSGSANVAPMFQITRSVPENSPAGTVVGDPVAVKEPDTGDTLTFGLTGDGAGNFAASADANGNAQVTVAEGAHLNYEQEQSYDLVLTVSDGRDASGNADPAIDHAIAVRISLEDVDETVAATVQAIRHDNFIRWTFTVTNPPAGATNVFYRFSLRDTTTELYQSGAVPRGRLSESFTFTDNVDYDSGTYRVLGSIQYDLDGAIYHVHADVSGDRTITIP